MRATKQAAPLLHVEEAWINYGRGRRARTTEPAVKGVTLELFPGQTIGIVGESGSGKSSLARAIARMGPISSGRILLDGEDMAALRGEALRRARRRFQMIFQNPSQSLNPRMTAVASVMEPILVHGLRSTRQLARERAEELLRLCALPPESWNRRSRNLSGGQQQRVAIARALAVEPELIIADEATSALDVSAQAKVINLLMDLQDALGVSYVFISHDLAVVRHIADTIAVMYRGEIVEFGTSDEVCDRPTHPYTKLLLESSPRIP